MVTLRNLISASLGLFLLTHCNNKQRSNTATTALLPSIETQPENPLAGEWKFRNSIWYSSALTLQDNGTFKFHDQGCYGQKLSQGKWTTNNGIIQLISFDTFRQKGQNEADKSNKFVDQNRARRKIKKGTDEYSFVSFKDVPSPVLPGPNDTIRIYLDKIQLQLKNDTLYCVGSVKLPQEAKFYRIKNYRQH